MPKPHSNRRPQNVTGFLKHIQAGLRRYGISMATRDSPKSIEKMILSTIAEVYKLSVRTIKTSNRRGMVTESKTMAIILLHKHAKLLQSELALEFDRTESLISKRLKAFALAKNGSKADKMFSQSRFIENYKIINEKIIVFKNSHV